MSRESDPREDRSRLAWLRHPLRVIATGLAAGCVVSTATEGTGLIAAVAGAAFGVLLGEWGGRSRWRAWVLAAAALAWLVALLMAAGLVTGMPWVARELGVGRALRVAQVVRMLAWTSAPVCFARAMALRFRPLVFVELAAYGAGVAWMFATHRGGLVARPLWLGDWAWRAGIDPTTVLLGVGAVAFVWMAMILATEHGRRTGVASIVVVAALSAWLWRSVDVSHRAWLPRLGDRDEPMAAHGEPPRPSPEGPRSDERKGAGDGSTGSGSPSQGERRPEGGGSDPRDATPSSDRGDASGERGGESTDDGSAEEGAPPPEGDGSPSDGERGASPPLTEPPSLDSPPPPPDSPAQQQPMAVVLLGDDYEPPGQMFYLRQESWSQFAGNRLVATTRPDADRDVPSEFPTRRVEVAETPAPTGRKRVHATVAMVLPHRKPIALESPVWLEPAANPDPRRFARAYAFEALAQSVPYDDLVTRTADGSSWSDDLRAYYTRAPTDPRYAALAREIVAPLEARGRKGPFLRALAVKLWMDENLAYSTRHRHAGVADPAADFLFGDRTGYCVHFAHAAVYLWRTLGLPARIGMGYAVNAESREGSSLMVRSGDGHAWPEVYVDGAGWVVLDIAPKRNLDPPPKPVDRELQRRLAQMARREPDPQRPRAIPPPATVSSARVPWRQWGLMLLVLVLALLYAAKVWRRVAPRFAGPRTIGWVGYRAALDRVGELGFVRRRGETRESFGRRVSPHVPSFARITEWHVASSFGDPGIPVASRPECSPAGWRDALAQLRRERSAHLRGWRPWLRRLNPASFLQSK